MEVASVDDLAASLSIDNSHSLPTVNANYTDGKLLLQFKDGLPPFFDIALDLIKSPGKD